MRGASSLQSEMQSRIDALLRKTNVPGYVAGVYWDGKSIELAAGVANLNSGVPMTPDTSFLLGSVTKVLVTSLLMHYVERGVVDLDAAVVAYLPELHLGDDATREGLTVRHLINHTSGIDAADFAPDFGRGADAIRRCVAALAGIGQVHPLGQYISYCNAGFVIAGRLLEVLTGESFDTILKGQLFRPLGLARTCTSGDEAILHRTAIGHIVEQSTGAVRPTRRFMLPYAIAPAGTTVITTVADLLRFARMHLDAGLTQDRMRFLSPESIVAMATETAPRCASNGAAVGLAWHLLTYGDTQILSHGGGSYGGASSLIVVPEKRFACAAFGNATNARVIHERLRDFLLTGVLGLSVPEPIEQTANELDARHYTGVYERQTIRTTVTANDGRLQIAAEYDYPAPDYGQAAMAREYGGTDRPAPVDVVPITQSLFMPEAEALDQRSGSMVTAARARSTGYAFLDPDETGRFRYLYRGLRLARRVD